MLTIQTIGLKNISLMCMLKNPLSYKWSSRSLFFPIICPINSSTPKKQIIKALIERDLRLKNPNLVLIFFPLIKRRILRNNWKKSCFRCFKSSFIITSISHLPNKKTQKNRSDPIISQETAAFQAEKVLET